MKILLDECIDQRLRRHFSNTKHQVFTVEYMGWKGLKNGNLLSKAEKSFDVFITADQNIHYQQNVIGFQIAILILSTLRNQLKDLIPLIPRIESQLEIIRPGEILKISEMD